jgi:hypothetical protein
MWVRLAVICDLPTSFACATPTTIPHEECSWMFLCKCWLRTHNSTVNVGKKNESSKNKTYKGAARRTIVTPPRVRFAYVYKKCNKADGDKQNP